MRDFYKLTDRRTTISTCYATILERNIHLLGFIVIGWVIHCGNLMMSRLTRYKINPHKKAGRKIKLRVFCLAKCKVKALLVLIVSRNS